MRFFGIAFPTSGAIAFGTGSRWTDFAEITSAPPSLLVAGVMSAGLIIGSSFLIPKSGLGAFLVLLVAGQVSAAMASGCFGPFGAPRTALTFGKVPGAAMVICVS